MDSTSVLDKPKGGDLRRAAQIARNVRYATQEADLHPLVESTGDDFVDHLRDLGQLEPGSAAFSERHLVGSMAPETVIEQLGPIGPEGFGIVRRTTNTGEILDQPRIYLP